MSGKIKESINQMLDSLVNGDSEDAKNLLNTILADKVQSSLENMKADVADQYFNGVKEEVEKE